jgi:hypothetical protein
MPDHGVASPIIPVALRLAEPFARRGVTFTFDQSPPAAFYLAAAHTGFAQNFAWQDDACGAMADGVMSPFPLGSIREPADLTEAITSLAPDGARYFADIIDVDSVSHAP